MLALVKIMPIAAAVVLVAGCLDPNTGTVIGGASSPETDDSATPQPRPDTDPEPEPNPQPEPDPEPDPDPEAPIPEGEWCERSVVNWVGDGTWHRVWDTSGRLVRQVRTEPELRTTQTLYDAQGRVVRTEVLETAGEPSEKFTNYWYHEGGIAEAWSCYPGSQGKEVAQTCERHWLRKRPDGQPELSIHGPDWVFSHTYDAEGRVIYTRTRYPGGVHEVYYSHDAETGLRKTAAYYDDGQPHSEDAFFHDAAGRLVRKERRALSPEHEPVGPLIGEMSYSYDAQGRLSRVEGDGWGFHEGFLAGTGEDADGQLDLVIEYGYACDQPRAEPVASASAPIPHTEQAVAYGDEAFVPAGTFYYGYPGALWEVDAFFIDRTEVDALTYQACVDDGACSEPSYEGAQPFGTYVFLGREYHPINYLTISQAEDVCAWAGKRLCEDAEWSKAARGGCELHGEACSDTADWLYYPEEVLDRSPSVVMGHDTRPIGAQGPTSPYGVSNMFGNVREWVHGESVPAVIRGHGFRGSLGGDSGFGFLGRYFADGDEAWDTTGVRCCRDAD